MSNPIEQLAAAFHHALLLGLKPNEYKETFWQDGKRIDTGKMKESRPRADMVDCVMFQQMWGSTALGFGGLGGAAMTSAYTVVITGPMGDACVYFGGRFAYRVDRVNEQFQNDMSRHSMHEVGGAKAVYERFAEAAP